LNPIPPILLVVCSVVAVVAFPARAAVTTPALKLPDPSLATTQFPVLPAVAFTANVAAPEPLNVPPDKKLPAVNALVVLLVTVILADPLNETPLIVLAVCNVVAVVAFPDKDAVTVPAVMLAYSVSPLL
jgi:hypothetical protein